MSDGSSKRQRLAVDDGQDNIGESAMSESTARACCWPDLVPSEVFLRVLSFLDGATRQELTLVNRRFWNEVEAYSQKLYETIKSNHRVDGTFDSRVGDQSSIRTVLEKPVKLPHRYRVKVGRKTPLYSIPRDQESLRIPPKMSLSPSENRIAVVHQFSTVQVFDLLSREHVATLGLQSIISDLCMLDDSRILICGNNRFDPFSIWTLSETGTWSSESVLQRNTELPFGVFWGIILSGPEIIYFGRPNHDTLICISVDINDGSIKRRFTIECGSTFHLCRMYQPSGENNRWLMFSIKTERKSSGLFIYNLEKNQRTFFLPETTMDFRLTQMSDCSSTFCTLKEGDGKAITIFGIDDDGQLSESFSFPVQSGKSLVGAFQSQVFVEEDDGKVVSYHVETGEQSQSPLGSAIDPAKNFRWSVSNSRNELLTIGYRTAIKAFCLQEPQFI